LTSVDAVEQIDHAVESCEGLFNEDKRLEGLEGLLAIFESFAEQGQGLHLQEPLLDSLLKLLHYLAKAETNTGGASGLLQDEGFCIIIRCLRIACDIADLIDKDQNFYSRTPVARGVISALVHLLLVNENRWASVFSETLLESCYIGIWKQCRHLQFKHDERKIKPIVEKGNEDRNLELQVSPTC